MACVRHQWHQHATDLLTLFYTGYRLIKTLGPVLKRPKEISDETRRTTCIDRPLSHHCWKLQSSPLDCMRPITSSTQWSLNNQLPTRAVLASPQGGSVAPFSAFRDSCSPHSSHTIWATVCVSGGGAVKPENWVSASGRWTHSTGHRVGFHCRVSLWSIILHWECFVSSSELRSVIGKETCIYITGTNEWVKSTLVLCEISACQ